MLAVFEKTTANPEPRPASVRILGKKVVPEEAIPTDMPVTAMKDLLSRFDFMYPSSIAIQKLPYCIIASKLDEQSITTQSYLVVKDDMICVFNGGLKDISVAALQEISGLKGEENKAVLVISAYRKCCVNEENRESSWCDIVKAFKGKFSFVTFDARDKTFFASTDPLGTEVPCYWGNDLGGNMVFSTNCQLAKASCDRFYGCIPGGCYVTTGKGLRSFQSPLEQIHVEPIYADHVGPVNKKPKV